MLPLYFYNGVTMKDNTEMKVPKHEHQKKLLKEDEQRLVGLKVVDEWHEINGLKLIKCTRKKNGNLYRTYVCRTDKEPEYVAQLKKDKQLR
jgi:hypothetical protein